jgi:folylpolyglutamate synthase/dihydropteroate synthase
VGRRKEVEKMIPKILPLAKKIYLTAFSSATDFGKRQGVLPSKLEFLVRKARSSVGYETIPEARKALKKAIKESEEGGVICVTGSLYLVGEVRSLVVK